VAAEYLCDRNIIGRSRASGAARPSYPRFLIRDLHIGSEYAESTPNGRTFGNQTLDECAEPVLLVVWTPHPEHRSPGCGVCCLFLSQSGGDEQI
jgi:hypothetical protein